MDIARIIKFPADFDGSLVGVGQACYKDKDEYGSRGKDALMEQFEVHFLMVARYTKCTSFHSLLQESSRSPTHCIS